MEKNLMRVMKVLVASSVMMLLGGCEEKDERLIRLSQQSVETQRQQNEWIAKQSEQVIKESHELAVAAKELVSADTEARQEMIEAQHKLNQQLSAERSSVDRQRDQLETERRTIATQRGRDPIIAAALHSIGTLLACLAPLGLVAFVLWQMGRNVDDGAELGDLLICELTAERPLLLAAPVALPKLENHPAKEAHDIRPEEAPPF